MKRFLPVGVIIVALLIILLVVRRCTSSSASNYQTATVTRGPITHLVTATGTLNPVVNVQVGSQVSGNIAKLYADFNSQVKAGQVVAQIDPMLFQAAVTQAEGDVANTQAALELAKVNATRTQSLFAQKNSSQQDLDTAMANLHQAEANVKIKQGALDKAKADLDHCTITSPIDGVVISRNVDVGQTVAASLQAPVIFQIANDLTKMQIDSNVAEADVGAVSVNQDVDFTVDAFPMQTFHGKVVQVRNAPISPQPRPRRRLRQIPSAAGRGAFPDDQERIRHIAPGLLWPLRCAKRGTEVFATRARRVSQRRGYNICEGNKST